MKNHVVGHSMLEEVRSHLAAIFGTSPFRLHEPSLANYCIHRFEDDLQFNYCLKNTWYPTVPFATPSLAGYVV